MKRVLITGGSRGIGRAIVEKFEKEGYEVIAPPRQELDLANPASVEKYVMLQKEQAPFDVIINNAGCNDIHLVEDITDEELTEMMNVNLIAPIRLIRGLIVPMKERRYGRIVNIASIWAVVSKAGRCVYSAAKNGIHGVTNTLAVELAQYNILVNTVCPGFTLTELTRKNNTEEEIAQISADIPMGRLAQPEEIAQVVYFLASDENTYLTGQKIAVDGGFTEK
ncbi:MAG: SDR family oxidoreductase [Ruminococcus flavefaciens]|nr:SDR family oxidoreductase [Ruminococcus flavefaciens]